MTFGLGMGPAFGKLGVLAGGGGVHIAFSPISLTINSSAGTVVGTATIVGSYTGTPVWSLTASFSGTFAISSNTGVVTIASTTNLTVGSDPITIHSAGTTPSPNDATFSISVTASSTSFIPSLDYSVAANSQYIPLMVP